MKQLLIKHNGLDYEFRWFQSTDEIQVIKEGKFTYNITIASGYVKCNCPGAKYHKKCWHVTRVGELKSQPTISESWAQWAEEAALMQRSGGNAWR